MTQILETHDSAFVYAGVRNPDSASALKDLETKYPTRITVVKCVSADVEGNTALAREIEKRHGRVDTVIANAGQSPIRSNYVITHILYLTKNVRYMRCSKLRLRGQPSQSRRAFPRPFLFTFPSSIGNSEHHMSSGQRNRHHRPLPSRVRAAQEKRYAALHPN